MDRDQFSEENLPATIDQMSKDWESHANDWAEEARDCYDLVAGHQWDEQDKKAMEDAMRPVVTFNRVGTFVDSVSGLEISNRQQTRYIPREMGDVGVNELLTSTADWARDNCDAEDEETEAFIDVIISGMGWTETSMDYEQDPEGMIKIDRRDPMEMEWDPAARKRNLSDARWVKRKIQMKITDIEDRWPEKAEAMALQSSSYPAGDNPHDSFQNWEYENDQGDNDEDPKRDEMEVAQLQWWERKPFFKVQTPQGIIELSPSQKNILQKYLPGLRTVRITKRVYKQAWVAGQTVMEIEDCPCDNSFTLKCMTGKRDRNNNTWYGMIRGLKDPQKWANKFLSSILEQSSNRGKGVMAEKNAFINSRKAEAEWANQNKITWMKDGALASGRVQPKPHEQPPTDLSELMGFSINSFRDVTGINMELMGLKDQQQAGVLEAQRKQAGISILSWCFDSMRKYRKEQGRVMAYFIREYISDGRLVRVSGQQGQRYVPLLKDEQTMVYDVVVDESPSSTNMKERVWSILQPLMPTLANLGVPIPPEIVDYLPLPETLIESWKKKMQPDPQAQQAQQQANALAFAKAQADVQETQSKAALNAAKAQGEKIDAQVDMQEAGLSRQSAEAEKVVKISQARKLAAETGKVLGGG